MAHPTFLDGEVRVIGPRWSPRVHDIKQFLTRSRVRFRWIDAGEDGRPPLVRFPDGTELVDPDVRDVAAKLGLQTEPHSTLYDLIIVGGGPAGLSASIHAASEGLRTVVVEREVPGGQVTYSAYIENYPGFPEALTGSDLAQRTVEQAERFGAEILVTRQATQLRVDGEHRVVALDDGVELVSHSVLLAIGVSFRWLDAPGCGNLVGAGIYYGAATAEAAACRNQDIYILGGGNSAGQAALLLARYARRVVILVHDDSLEESMSKYLVDRIRQTPNIEVRTNAAVAAAEGRGHLERLIVEDVRTGKQEEVPAEGLFVFIGARPRTEWLEHVVARDEEGFVLSGADFRCDLPEDWRLERPPYLLETTTPGVFVAGDVRKGSVKRLTSAAGEGTMAVHFIHRYCRELAEAAIG